VHEPSHLIDLMGTALDVAGAAYPKRHAGEDIIPLEGRSLRPWFLDPAAAPAPRPLYWEHEGNKAMRLGPWKLVAKHGGAWELYDIDRDRTESRNLAAAHPERARAMAAQWQVWADRVGVMPWTYDIPEGSGTSPTAKKKREKGG
jgi:arylsulfatase